MREAELAEVLRQPLFAGMDRNQASALTQAAFLQKFPAHVDLAREGDAADFLHIVIDGQVELFASYRGRETTVSVLGAGHAFIIAAVLLDRVYLKSARTMLPSRILLLPAEAVRRVFADSPTFACALSMELAWAYRGVVQELKNQKLRSGLERLANWLIARNAETGGTGAFDLPFEKRVLASRLGMVPEALSRAFAALVPYKVSVRGPHIRIQDPTALHNLAQPTPTIDDPKA